MFLIETAEEWMSQNYLPLLQIQGLCYIAKGIRYLYFNQYAEIRKNQGIINEEEAKCIRTELNRLHRYDLLPIPLDFIFSIGALRRFESRLDELLKLHEEK